MEQRPIAAIMYDFDRTLSPKNMQEYGAIPGTGLSADEFWRRCNETMKQHSMDPILAYMFVLMQSARGKMLLTRDVFFKLGASVQLFPGVETFFKRVNTYGDRLGLDVEHYIISSGQKEIIEGTSIAGAFKKIYAAEFCYDADNVPVWPAMAVNYTSKTQFLFRINKGVLDETEHDALNESTPEDERRVPFASMIYIGDGLTDVPCMKLLKGYGGHSIAVYEDEPDELVAKMLMQGRVDYILRADYSEKSQMEKTVFAILDRIIADKRIEDIRRGHDRIARRVIEK